MEQTLSIKTDEEKIIEVVIGADPASAFALAGLLVQAISHKAGIPATSGARIVYEGIAEIEAEKGKTPCQKKH